VLQAHQLLKFCSDTNPSNAHSRERIEGGDNNATGYEFHKGGGRNRAEVTYLSADRWPTTTRLSQRMSAPGSGQCAGENGLGLEEYVEDLVANANTQSLKIIDTSEGVQTISNEGVGRTRACSR